MYGKGFYDDVADALTGFLPPSMRHFEWYRTNHNLKLWYGENGREHYEVQLLKWGKAIGLEIGFHAEHKDKQLNDDAVNKLIAAEARWRKDLGKQPEAGAFIGSQSGSWRRLSEFWDGASQDPDVAIEAAARLASYIRALEPLRA